jgi:glycine/D-amino acid oxidase-like deaminating enzyme
MDRLESSSGMDGLFLCTGFSGHGLTLAPAVGRAMAALVLNDDSSFLEPPVDISQLRLSRFLPGATADRISPFSDQNDVII